ncbi:transporter [Marinitenerispora sediminis]|uniref:Transporter n=2 Tax=Marinitenerispora sediminis TaxID=1931232 RepID=A0A368T8Q0_9ACTN|nr:transporter [Marinitenerispora sediminis]RCV58817.1 transporter [Marinitenerispora sediminis]RCV61304.1 transporter [Marinitenerispora sediminis]
MLTFAQACTTAVELLAVVIVFGHAGRLGGFTLDEAMLFYGLTGTAFSTAHLLIGTVDRLGEHIRRGSLDTVLIRPVSPLVQIATEEFSPRRLGRTVPSAAALGYALSVLDIAWTPERVLMVPLLIGCGALICGSLWVTAASVQFLLTDARELVSSVTNGGWALTEYPLAIYGRDVVRAVTYLVPLAFVSWQPALYILDRPDPLGMPDWLRYASPAVAAAAVAVAALVWRTGLRHYRSTGS